jgi:hypothetical protein
MDARKNFAYTTVSDAPTPATTGTALTVASGGVLPTVPFNATVWPAGESPLTSNAEIVRVTANAGGILTIVRQQESTSARTIVAGDQFSANITALFADDIETAINVVSNAVSAETSARAAAVNTVSNLLSVAIVSIATVSNAVSVEAASRVAADNTISNAVSVVSQALSVETAARVSGDNLLSSAISVISQAASNALSVANAASNAASVVSNALSVANASHLGAQRPVEQGQRQ